ncbi:MAG: HD-GYP domain-containing protein, partial [Clostridiales bacterium]|nr:HD-GYP domain-containing protein [Clostridiales bacterium]
HKIIYDKKVCLMQFYSREKLLGFLKLYMKEEIHSQQILDIMHIAYTNAEKVLSNLQLNYYMHETQKRLVHSLAMISESKSEQTGQHIYRVGEYMKIMGQELGLSEKKCDELSLAAMLHDVGKMAIPSEILDKPGKLTSEEFEVIKTHVTEGYKLLKECPGEMMELGREIAYQHHEKWDGTGYLKKKGKEINEYATYVAVIDVFDALISKRSYKEAWSTKDAYDEIIRCSGTHFSPKAVELFQKVYSKLLQVAERFPD